MIKANYWKRVLVLMVVGAMGWAGAAQAQTHTEDFESGYNLGQNIGSHQDWYDGGNGPTVDSDIGVAGSVGLSPANNIFNWTAHPFNWSEVIKVVFGMDFQTDGSGYFDDDRIGWTINSGSVDSSNFFGVQMDPGGSGYNIEGYWDGVSSADRRPSIANLPALSTNAWYRFQVEITKLPDTSSIDVELWSLDSSGDPDTLVVSESITTDIGTLGVDAPHSKYFTSGLCPAYKNYNALEGAADNAYFHVELGELPPEPDPEGTLVSPAETVWKYLDDGSDQGTAWREPLFDDSGWEEGPAQLGYGGDGEVTTISYGTDPDNKYICYYFRHSFDVADASQVGSLKLRLVRDDGAVVYLNGVEIVRSNMPDGTIYYDTTASLVVGGDDESKWFEFDVDPAGLVDGENVLAVEIHQINGTSTDISFNLGLAETEHIRKGPYLFYTGVNTEMMALWQVDVPQGCTLEWGTDPANLSESAVTTEIGSDHQHEYTIGGDIEKPPLVPGTKYYYKVTVGSGGSYTGSFTTAPAVNADNVKFLAFGDMRADAGLVPYNYDLVCEAMNSFTITNPDYQTLVLNVGDWINNDTEYDWQNMFFNRSLSNVLELHANMPINGCIGNHEGAGIVYDKYYPYPYEAGGRYWSFDYGPVHIAIVDQYTSYSSGSPQLLWLDNDLATSDKLWKIIVLHEPGWSVGPHPDNGSVQNYIQPLCLAHDVDIVFGGHNHNYARCDVDGIQHVTTGGGGAPLRSVNLDTNLYVVAGESTLEFCEIEIQGDTLYFSALRPDHSEIDSFEKTKPWPEASSPGPADGEQNVALNADLGWTAGVGAVNHDVYLGTDLSAVAAADTLSPEYETTQAGTTYGPLSLSSGITYYWRIDEFDGTTTYEGNVWSFTTFYNPQQASNPSPAYAETGVDIDADLSWDAGAGAIEHNVYLWYEESEEVNVYVVNGTSTSETTYSPPVLAPATMYYWRIDELDGGGSLIAAGLTWSFETIAAPGQASGPSPTIGATDVAIDADLSWTAGSDTTSHDVYFGTNPTPDSVQFQGNQAGTTFDPGSMDYVTTYYWRIDEVGPGGTTTGVVWSFTTVPPPPPGQAANPSPADGVEGVLVDADLSWDAGVGAETHDVYFGIEPGALPLVSVKQGGTSYELGTLEKGITYYWRIDEYNSNNEKTEGVLWSFTTVLPAPPAKATPSAPVYEGSAVDVPDVGVFVILAWLSGDRAASHDVYFGINPVEVFNADNDSPEFKGNILQQDGMVIPDVGTYFTWDPTPGLGEALPYVSSYWWRIDEINPGGITKGDIWNFTTESDTYPPIFTYAPQVNPDSITAHEATITWTTNEPADSLVEYGITGYDWSVHDTNEVTSHSVTLTGLQPNTTYNYRVTSTDHAGNPASEVGLPFTTEENTPPVAVNDSATTTEGVAVVIDVLANDSDFDGDTLTVESVTQGTNGSVVDNGDGTVSYTPIGAAPYTDTFQYTINDGYGGTDTATVTVEVSEPYVDYLAYDEITAYGTVTGSYSDTQFNDAVNEVIEEVPVRPNSNAYSILEHKWLIDVPGSDQISFHINAYRSSYDSADNFVFAYSTDDLTYIDMLTVTKTDDQDNTYQTYTLPNSISGTVYIRVSDTDDTRKELVFGQVYVDHMFIRCETAVPDTTAPTPNPITWASVPQATGSTSISMTATTASDASGEEYYFACITDAAHDSGWQDSPTYEDTGLSTGTPYTYQVQARDKSPAQNATGWSSQASATPMDVPPAPPTGLAATPGDSQVSLDWNDNTESDLDGYNVYRSEDPGGPYTQIATLPDTSDYLDSGLVNGMPYYYVVTAVDQASNESGNSNEASATPDSLQTVSVESIDMAVVLGKKFYATATIAITPELDGATVVGDWYLKGVLRTIGATALTNESGIAVFTSFETPAKSGDTFMFVVTDVVFSGYIYDPGQSVTSGSIAVP